MLILHRAALVAIDIALIVAAVQYVCYAASRIHAYWIQTKRTNLKNPKYSLDDLDRIYKAKKEKESRIM